MMRRGTILVLALESDQTETAAASPGQQAVNEGHLFTQAAFTFVQSPAHFLSEVSAHTKQRERERETPTKKKKTEDEESCGNV